jgi:hypothetical protein
MADQAFIVGELDEGTDGRTLLLCFTSPTAAWWLRSVFRALSAGGEPFEFTADPMVRIRGMHRLELSVSTGRKYFAKSLFLSGVPPDGQWICGVQRWAGLADLLDPFVRGDAGHQYLTENDDDATIVVSLGEYEETRSGLRFGA